MTADAFTAHARQRSQQRAIPDFVVELLERFGASLRCHGAERLFFDKSARKHLRAHFGGNRNMRIIEPWLNVYAVIGDNGLLVTVARQSRRHRRP